MTDREKTIAGLRGLADFLGTHPDVPVPYMDRFYCWIDPSQLRPIARALRTFKKEYSGTDFQMAKPFGPLTLTYVVNREAVCKKVVVGTKEVPEMIIAAKPEQLIPASEQQIIPAHTEEVTEWVCSDAALMEETESAPEAPRRESLQMQSEEMPF